MLEAVAPAKDLSDSPLIPWLREKHSQGTVAPTLVQAAVDGRLPRGVGVATLRDFPAEWVRQYKRLGLSS